MLNIMSFATEEIIAQNKTDIFSWGKKIRENKKVFYDGRVTAISASRRTGKTQFIIDSLKMLIKDGIAEDANIYVHDRMQKDLILQALDEQIPDWKNWLVRIEVISSNDAVRLPFNQCRTVNFVDEAYYQPERVMEAIASYGKHGASTWILVGTGLYTKSSKKNPFKACFELPYIRTYDVKMSEECFKQLGFKDDYLGAGDIIVKGIND